MPDFFNEIMKKTAGVAPQPPCGREGGRAKQRPGELTIQATLTQMQIGELTHPICAPFASPKSSPKERTLNSNVKEPSPLERTG